MASTGLIHTVLIATTSGNILHSHHYDTTNEEHWNRRDRLILDLTRDMWPRESSNFTAPTVTSFIDDTDGISKVLAFSQCNDLMFFVVGSGEYDEMVLSELVQSIWGALRIVCCNEGLVNEANVLKEYRKLILALDDIIVGGITNLIDPDLISASASMSLDKARK